MAEEGEATNNSARHLTHEKNANSTRFFYQNGKLITLQTADHGRSIVRTADVLLAEQQSGDAQTHGLLVTDDKGSVLQVQVKS